MTTPNNLALFRLSLIDVSMTDYTSDELRSIAWACERLARDARNEVQARDARVVDEACALEMPNG